MRKAIVAIEDYRFYQHGALDLKGTLRALVTNQASGGVVQGGSSITQQMVKMTLRQPGQDARRAQARRRPTPTQRKINELRYAIAFEQNYSKDWILERYLNIAYFGDGAYGIAGRRPALLLTTPGLDLLREAATAGRPGEEPHRLRPDEQPRPRPSERRNIVLDRMAQLNVISQREADERQDAAARAQRWPTPQRLRHLRRAVLLRLRRPVPRARPARSARPSTTAAQAALQRRPDHQDHDRPALPARRRHLGAAATSTRPTRRSAAWRWSSRAPARCGRSRSRGRWAATPRRARPTSTTSSPRSTATPPASRPGSTFKAFVLVGGDRAGHPAHRTKINAPHDDHDPDEPATASAAAASSPAPTSGTPQNSTGAGTVDLYTGTQRVGEHLLRPARAADRPVRAVRLAKEMGVDAQRPEQRDGAVVHPRRRRRQPAELADAYATFAARGLHCDARPVTSIDDSNGNELEDLPEQCQQVIAHRVADAVNDILRGVQEPTGFGASLARSTRSRPARPAPSTTTWRSGSSATPRTSPPRR